MIDEEKRYRQVDKEALVAIFVVKNIFHLYGNRFSLFTDSKPLVSVLSPFESSLVLSAARILRYAIYLQRFQYDICYKKTTEHGNIDAPLRLSLCSEDLSQQFNSNDVIDDSGSLRINQLSVLILNSISISSAIKSDLLYIIFFINSFLVFKLLKIYFWQ